MRRETLAAGVLGAVLGSFGGAVGFTAHFARATSYLSDDPKACVNCHIMNDQYDAWSRASHHARATCNDCHVPHQSIFAKYAVKAEHGYRHSKKFTFQNWHEPIAMTASSYDVVVDNCIRCHEEMTRAIGHVDCLRCHASVAHGPTR